MSLALEAEEDIDLLTRDEMQTTLDTYAKEKGHEDYNSLRHSIAKDNGYRCWESFTKRFRRPKIVEPIIQIRGIAQLRKIVPPIKLNLSPRSLKRLMFSKNKYYRIVKTSTSIIEDVEIPQTTLNLLQHKTGWKYDELRDYGFL